jgi:hypothetical protein
MIDASPAVNATLYDKLNFDVLRDIAAIAAVAQQPRGRARRRRDCENRDVILESERWAAINLLCASQLLPRYVNGKPIQDSFGRTINEWLLGL